MPNRYLALAGKPVVVTIYHVSHLEVTLGLHEPPHDPKRAEEVPIGVGCQAGDDGMVRPLVWCHTVGVLLVQYEVVASVLQNKAAPFGHYACDCMTDAVRVQHISAPFVAQQHRSVFHCVRDCLGCINR